MTAMERDPLPADITDYPVSEDGGVMLDERRKDSKSYIQWIATLGVLCLMVQVGIHIGWASPNFAKFESPDSPIHLTPDDISWLATAIGMGGVVGSLLGSASLELIGTRKAIALNFCLVSSSWVCFILATSTPWLIVGRLLAGVSCSLAYTCFSLYLGEISEASNRGTLITIAAGGNPLGIVIGTVAETYLPMHVSSSGYLAVCALGLGLFFWLHDSPYYLMKRSRVEAARRSITSYHGRKDLDLKLSEVKGFLDAQKDQSFTDRLRQVNSPVVRKCMLLIVVLFALPHLAGGGIVASYMEIILERSKARDLVDPKQFVIYANLVGVIGTALTFKLMDLLGRKSLLVISCIGTTVALLGLGIYFYALKNDTEGLESWRWLPIASIMLFVFSYASGFSPVPGTVLSEIFPENVKSIAALVAAISASVFSSVAARTYQILVDSYGDWLPFCMHAAMSVCLTVIVLFMMPETKGKTFQEIQKLLRES